MIRKFILNYVKHFNEKYNNHGKSFRNEASNKETEVSKYIWLLKDSNRKNNIKWRIVKQVTAKQK